MGFEPCAISLGGLSMKVFYFLTLAIIFSPAAKAGWVCTYEKPLPMDYLSGTGDTEGAARKDLKKNVKSFAPREKVTDDLVSCSQHENSPSGGAGHNDRVICDYPMGMDSMSGVGKSEDEAKVDLRRNVKKFSGEDPDEDKITCR